jgi:hypothetical protein
MAQEKERSSPGKVTLERGHLHSLRWNTDSTGKETETIIIGRGTLTILEPYYWQFWKKNTDRS